MDTVSFRDLSVAETDTKTVLAHANQQAIQRRYEDFFIADVDAHHYEVASFAQIIEYIDDPVMRGSGQISRLRRGRHHHRCLRRRLSESHAAGSREARATPRKRRRRRRIATSR